MRNRIKLRFSIMLVLFLFISMLFACNVSYEDPTQGYVPSNPANEGDITEPTQGDEPSDPTGNSSVAPDQEEFGTPQGSDSSFMDGEDHVQAPFGN